MFTLHSFANRCLLVLTTPNTSFAAFVSPSIRLHNWPKCSCCGSPVACRFLQRRADKLGAAPLLLAGSVPRPTLISQYKHIFPAEFPGAELFPLASEATLPAGFTLCPCVTHQQSSLSTIPLHGPRRLLRRGAGECGERGRAAGGAGREGRGGLWRAGRGRAAHQVSALTSLNKLCSFLCPCAA